MSSTTGTIKHRYDPEYDTRPDGPPVTWAEHGLALDVERLEERLDRLQGLLEKLGASHEVLEDDHVNALEYISTRLTRLEEGKVPAGKPKAHPFVAFYTDLESFLNLINDCRFIGSYELLYYWPGTSIIRRGNGADVKRHMVCFQWGDQPGNIIHTAFVYLGGYARAFSRPMGPDDRRKQAILEANQIKATEILARHVEDRLESYGLEHDAGQVRLVPGSIHLPGIEAPEIEYGYHHLMEPLYTALQGGREVEPEDVFQGIEEQS